ncbi:lysozyme inhibitor LprI family protein [Pseudomonas sp. RHF3.3-3]|uniref:lysozyme inhibitor LprI family protein n=1 Tax=Pseudomonas sp. RHF3.3-3 TaxID=3396624 RepID=UPI003A8C67AB
MSVFVKVRAVLVFSMLGIGSCLSVFADDQTCSLNTTLGVAQCSGEKLKILEQQLQSSYEAALDELPETDNWDTRKTKGQLIRAQTAWKTFRDEHCSYVGGLQGGNNMMVNVFSNECAIEETKKRIGFFSHLPRGG